MAADLLIAVVLGASLKIVACVWRVLAEGAKAVRRAADVGRKTSGEKHTAVEYVDALLFPENDHHSAR
jgi:hypothetical protein